MIHEGSFILNPAASGERGLSYKSAVHIYTFFLFVKCGLVQVSISYHVASFWRVSWLSLYDSRS